MEKLGISNTTYYVYNAKNELRYILSPSYQEAGYKDLYAYEYRYDDHSNIVKKGYLAAKWQHTGTIKTIKWYLNKMLP